MDENRSKKSKEQNTFNIYFVIQNKLIILKYCFFLYLCFYHSEFDCAIHFQRISPNYCINSLSSISNYSSSIFYLLNYILNTLSVCSNKYKYIYIKINQTINVYFDVEHDQ